MKLTIKRVDTSLPLPKYYTRGSVGLDLYARKKMIVKPQQLGFIPLNIIVKVPAKHMLLLVPRSSTPKKKNLLIPHGVGVIDQDYCGEKDELLFQVYNFSTKPVEIKRGERIAQALLVKISKAELKEVRKMKTVSRGGIGSTD